MCIGRRWIFKFLFLFIWEYLNIIHTNASTPNQLNATFHTRKFKSGPIFLLDKHTIFVSLFEYSHNGINNIRKQSKWFKAKAAGEDSFVMLYYSSETNTGDLQLAQLSRDYQRENIYLRTDESLKDITRFESLVIVNDKDVVQASVDISLDHGLKLDDTIDNPLIKNDTYIFRYPKCCPLGKYRGFEDCVDINNQPKSRVPVYLAKGLQFYSEAIQNITYEPFQHEPQCDNMYYLDEQDEYYMLINGRLLYGFPHFACMDFVENENNTLVEVVFMCSPNNTEIILVLNDVYVILMYISSAVLLIWATVLTIVLVQKMGSVKTLKGISIIYSVFYAIHFIILATARTLGVISDMCKIMGYLYQFFLVSSFSALLALIYEGYYRVKHYCENHSTTRMYFYLAYCLIPIITTIFSIATNELTLSESDRTERDNACWFRSERKIYFYFVPILIIISICMVIQIITYFDIRKANRKAQACWLVQKRTYDEMFRLGVYINGIMTVCWVLEVVAYCIEAPNAFWYIVDGINSMQGIAIFIAFSYHYSNVWKKLLRCKATSERATRLRSEQMSEMTQLKA